LFILNHVSPNSVRKLSNILHKVLMLGHDVQPIKLCIDFVNRHGTNIARLQIALPVGPGDTAIDQRSARDQEYITFIHCMYYVQAYINSWLYIVT